MTAALGVMLDTNSNTQKFFGGGESKNERRSGRNNQTCHNDDLSAIAISNDRSFAVTGQRGPYPAVFAWDSNSGDMKTRVQLTKGARGIAAASISSDDKYMAVVDMSNEHCISVFEIDNGTQCFNMNGDTNYIYDIAFTA